MFGWKSESWLAGRMGSIVHWGRGFEMLFSHSSHPPFGISPFKNVAGSYNNRQTRWVQWVGDHMLNVVNSHCAHKSRILILMFSCVGGEVSSYWESQSSKNLSKAVVERAPISKSFFISNKNRQAHWFQMKALASLKTHLVSNKGICWRNLNPIPRD